MERSQAGARAGGAKYDGFLPGRHAIEGYAAGGFSFGGMSHRGAILATPSGVRAVAVSLPAEIDIATLAPLFDEAPGAVDFLILGTGAGLVLPPRSLREELKARGVGVDPMATAHAISTYNILIGESRPVAALLLPLT